VAHVAENYGGRAAIEAVVDGYPDLTFSGMMIHEQSHPGDTYWGFRAINGETEWHEFSLLEDYRPMTPDEIEGELTGIDQKIAGLTKRREFYIDQLRKSEADPKKSTEPTSDSKPEDGSIVIRKTEEVLAVIEKLKAGTAAKRG
jgi:hypothetical protein